MKHALVKLARTVDGGFLEERFGAVYSDKPGQPPLPARLMAGLAILKYTHDLSDEVLCERWVENPWHLLSDRGSVMYVLNSKWLLTAVIACFRIAANQNVFACAGCFPAAHFGGGSPNHLGVVTDVFYFAGNAVVGKQPQSEEMLFAYPSVHLGFGRIVT